MSDDRIEAARKGLGDIEGRVSVRSAAPLTDAQLDRLRKLLIEKLGDEKIELDVKEDPSLLAGLEVTLGHVQLEAHWRGVIDEALKKQMAAT